GLGQPNPPLAANDNPVWWKRHALPLGGAIAASIAAALLIVPNGPAESSDALSLALDHTPSLAQATLPDGRTITPILTARAGDGRWCREFGDGGEVALACRDAKGVWAIEAKAKGAAPADNTAFAVASGKDSAVLDAANARLKTADPLDAQAERALIAKEWGGHP
ncbi:MAG: hypothetical protein V4521_05155, partial [Pseudomonadota bacterium]